MGVVSHRDDHFYMSRGLTPAIAPATERSSTDDNALIQRSVWLSARLRQDPAVDLLGRHVCRSEVNNRQDVAVEYLGDAHPFHLNRPELHFPSLHRSVITAHAPSVAPPRCGLAAPAPPGIKSRTDNGFHLRKKLGPEPPFQRYPRGTFFETCRGREHPPWVRCGQLINDGIHVSLNVGEVELSGEPATKL